MREESTGPASTPSHGQAVQPSEGFEVELATLHQEGTTIRPAPPAVEEATQPDLTAPLPPVPNLSTPPDLAASAKQGPRFNLVYLAINCGIVLLVLAMVFGALVYTHVIPIGEFKPVTYTNSRGITYSLQFYSKNSTKRLVDGNTELVSKMGKYGKFPLSLSIGLGSPAQFESIKDCQDYKKVFEVQNDNIGQKISVCDITEGTAVAGLDATGSAYVAGFLQGGKSHIITISQSYADINLTDQSAARQAMSEFGIQPYDNDIKRIIASIKVD